MGRARGSRYHAYLPANALEQEDLERRMSALDAFLYTNLKRSIDGGITSDPSSAVALTQHCLLALAYCQERLELLVAARHSDDASAIDEVRQSLAARLREYYIADRQSFVASRDNPRIATIDQALGISIFVTIQRRAPAFYTSSGLEKIPLRDLHRSLKRGSPDRQGEWCAPTIRRDSRSRHR